MRTRLRRIKLRNAALFALVAAAVAVSTVLIGRESGVGDEAGALEQVRAAAPRLPAEQEGDGDEAPQDAAPTLSLSLSAPEICETTRAEGSWDSHWSVDDDGRNQITDLAAWARVTEIPVEWSVSGGAAPYELVIDGETRDATQEYRGASGTAIVSCALDIGETVIGGPYEDRYRRHLTEPLVDSGLKTIRATVSDARGTTAEATADVYVILDASDSGTPLSAGQTYRIWEWLITIPDQVTTAFTAGSVVSEGGEGVFSIGFTGPGYRAFVQIGFNTGRQYNNEFQLRPLGDEAGAQTGTNEETVLSLLDEIAASVGRPPQGMSE